MTITEIVLAVAALGFAVILGAIGGMVYFLSRLMVHLQGHHYVCTRCGTILKQRIMDYRSPNLGCSTPLPTGEADGD